MFSECLFFLAAYWPVALLAVIIFYTLRNKFHNGLSKYPGPTLAAYTDLWRFFENYSRDTHRTHLALHKRHGDIVRLGPNELSFADPQAIKVIYGLNKGMLKSEFYPVQMAVAKGERLPSLFSTRDEQYHAKYRRCVSNAFAMSSLVHFEPLVDSTTDCFIEQTKQRYCSTGRACSFSTWLQYYAFDVIGELTWSRRLGFLERDEDVDGIINSTSNFFSYAGPVGQLPLVDRLWLKNPIKMQLEKWGVITKVFPVTLFAQKQSARRATEMEKIKQQGVDEQDTSRPMDMLTKFTQAQRDHPEFMTDKQVMASCTSMVFAGSETTAISLSSVFYFLLKNPRAYEKLMEELDTAQQSGLIAGRENQKVSWAESQKLPYLDAVIQESFRMHPAPGLLLERVVPPQGIEILGEEIKGGTIVGCNAWVVHRRREIFGTDADVFRPERWLEAKPEQLKGMHATMLQFGAGARTCIGKNISLLELYKLVPTFLRNFEVKFERPDADWRTWNAWFVSQKDFMTTFRPRSMPAAV